jgi:hypothetical protein
VQFYSNTKSTFISFGAIVSHLQHFEAIVEK